MSHFGTRQLLPVETEIVPTPSRLGRTFPGRPIFAGFRGQALSQTRFYKPANSDRSGREHPRSASLIPGGGEQACRPNKTSETLAGAE